MDNDSIRVALKAWKRDKDAAERKYGRIRDWDTSKVTDFSELFKYEKNFNEDLSLWDVSNGKTFYRMFAGATSFNGNISGWNVSRGRNFFCMFNDASSFDSDISGWDVSSGTNFGGMFNGAKSFSADLSLWNVSCGIDFQCMFAGASSFDANLSHWPTFNGRVFSAMMSSTGANAVAPKMKWTEEERQDAEAEREMDKAEIEMKERVVAKLLAEKRVIAKDQKSRDLANAEAELEAKLRRELGLDNASRHAEEAESGGGFDLSGLHRTHVAIAAVLVVVAAASTVLAQNRKATK